MLEKRTAVLFDDDAVHVYVAIQELDGVEIC